MEDVEFPEGKIYYSISEVSKMLDLNQSTLRSWEPKFSVLKPPVSSGGTRRYTQKDIELLRLIKYLLYERHMTIEGANRQLSKNYDSEVLRKTVTDKLKAVRSELLAIRRELNTHDALKEEVIVDAKTED